MVRTTRQHTGAAMVASVVAALLITLLLSRGGFEETRKALMEDAAAGR